MQPLSFWNMIMYLPSKKIRHFAISITERFSKLWLQKLREAWDLCHMKSVWWWWWWRIGVMKCLNDWFELNLISSWSFCWRFSSSQNFDTPRAPIQSTNCIFTNHELNIGRMKRQVGKILQFILYFWICCTTKNIKGKAIKERKPLNKKKGHADFCDSNIHQKSPLSLP